MMIDRMLRLLALMVLLALLAACAGDPPPALPTPTPLPRAVVLPITALLAEPQRWSGQSITVVGPVVLTSEDRVLLARMGDSATAITQTGKAIWIEQQPPDTITSQLSNGTGLLKIRGKLSPPGAYGREQRFPYQISAETIEALKPEQTTLINLAQNPRALDRILLTVEGTLLAQKNSALLTDKVSEGGVPVGTHQIKLPNADVDPDLLAQLKSSGEVRWGAVQVLGWWQDGALTPFRITLAAAQ